LIQVKGRHIQTRGAAPFCSILKGFSVQRPSKKQRRATNTDEPSNPHAAAGIESHVRVPNVPTADADLALVARTLAGEVAAFETLYRAHAGRLLALTRRLSGNAARAEELLQDVFVRAYERLASFRGESAFSTWLHRLAVNVVLEERRSRGRRDARFVLSDDLTSHDRGSSPPDRGTALDLEAAIAALPEGARTVLVLYDVEGYQHDEIAALLGVTTGTTKAQLFRARKLLREALER
jgi:RNA polymerase sigma-70 factor (ECF subfamily)